MSVEVYSGWLEMGSVFGGEHGTGPQFRSYLCKGDIYRQRETRVSEIGGCCLPGPLETGVATCGGNVFGR